LTSVLGSHGAWLVDPRGGLVLRPALLTLALTCVGPAAAQTSFDRLTLELEEPARSSTLELTPDGILSLRRSVGTAAGGPVHDQASPGERAALLAAFARARVATLPVVMPGAGGGGPTLTLTVEVGATTYRHVAPVGGEAARARPLIRALRGLLERALIPVPGERVLVTGGAFATYGRPLPGHPFAIGLDLRTTMLMIMNEPFATLAERAIGGAFASVPLELSGTITRDGLDREAGGLAVEWLGGVASRDLDVHVVVAGALMRTPSTRR
jgi:hypothetical protein